MGVVSPNGMGVEAFASSLHSGRSGLSRLEGPEYSSLKSTIAGQVLEFDPHTILDPAECRRVPRLVPMALASAREALFNARLSIDPQDVDAQRQVGVILGTGGGGIAFVEEQYRAIFQQINPSLYSVTGATHGNLSSELSIQLQLRGLSHVISTGCTSSTDAIGYAVMMIRAGVLPAFVVGGADAPISAGILGAFEKMKVVSTRRWDKPCCASRPFSRDRDGFILGEGAWMFVIESLDRARLRGAPILAEVAGYGSTCDAYHRVQIAPDVVESSRAIELALADAGVEAATVDYVNLHGTGTVMNDRLETLAIKKALSDHARRIPMSATKSMIGHPQGACGAAGVAATILAMRTGVVHPTINLDDRDPECDLDYVPNRARQVQVKTALCNCIAFGSKNSALVLRQFTG